MRARHWLQIENTRGGWTNIASALVSDVSRLDDEARLFQSRGFCMRIKFPGGVSIEYLAEDHDETE